MIYVTSDLHGLPLERLTALLDKAGFSDSDWLYVLGDVTDRLGDGGVQLLRWLTTAENAELILGNHESMLLSCRFAFDEITDESISAITDEKLDLLSNYIYNGGDVTLNSFKALKRSDPQAVEGILDYLCDAPLYETVSAAGRDFLLCHAGLGNFKEDKKLFNYTPDELLWTRPDINDKYFDDALTVFGHTPTFFYGEKYKGRILKTPTWIDIDVGVTAGNPPALLRLDDLAEFYL